MLYASEEQQKDKAIEYLRRLNILPEFIENFTKNDTVFIFEDGTGYNVIDFKDKEVIEKMKQIEEEKNIKVYAIILSSTTKFQFCDFLYVDDDSETWDFLFTDTLEENKYLIYSYCWNRTREEYSELGRIIVQSSGGGLFRIG